MVETVYRIPGAPRLALLADLHGRDPAPVLSSLTTHRPSLICLAGDIVYGTWPEDNVSPLVSQPNVLPFFRACAAIAPTFFSLGNHEQMLDQADLAAIADTGVVVLDNEWREWNGLVIGGLTSGYVTDYRRYKTELGRVERYPKKEAAEQPHTPDISWLKDFCAVPGDHHLLLSHHPEVWPEIREYDIDLCLSAHAHGGQIRFYDLIHRRWQGLWAPGQYWFPRLTEGVHENRLVISRGLSNTARVPRLFNPVEVVFVEPE